VRYQQKSFSVSMPGTSAADWPFEAADTRSKQRRAEAAGLSCSECGKYVLPGSPHVDLRDKEAGRPRRRVCFGKVRAK
jgi:hypothetical protein